MWVSLKTNEVEMGGGEMVRGEQGLNNQGERIETCKKRFEVKELCRTIGELPKLLSERKTKNLERKYKLNGPVMGQN